ncbi:MAG: YqgE/AlgH family protein [Nocardioidaceae bacterium]|nr:YqgE/AlgH family protein [Nocardioidaceae bacterium]
MPFYAGQLLVATPELLHPEFNRTVVLLLDHDEDGAIGVVLNRPMELPLRAVLPDWAESVAAPHLLFSGGPVSRESALAVGLSLGDGPADSFRRLTGDFGLIDLDAEPGSVLQDLIGLRVFSGYAGWGHEQLTAEIEEGSWYIVNAVPTDLLTSHPEELWRSILRRQPGELANLSTMPDDPTLN